MAVEGFKQPELAEWPQRQRLTIFDEPIELCRKTLTSHELRHT